MLFENHPLMFWLVEEEHPRPVAWDETLVCLLVVLIFLEAEDDIFKEVFPRIGRAEPGWRDGNNYCNN